MASSKFKVETERRRNLYFNKFSYRATFYVPDVHCMRYYKSYDDYITFERGWGSWNGSNKNKPLANKDELERYFDYKDNHAGTAKVRVEYGKVVVYASSLAELDAAYDKIQPSGGAKYYQVIVPVEEGTIEFAKEPEYKFRNYFRARVITSETKDMLKNFIVEQQSFGTKVAFNQAMMIWLNRLPFSRTGNSYLQESFYVEYDDEKLQALFALMFGEYLKPKIFRLVKRPD